MTGHVTGHVRPLTALAGHLAGHGMTVRELARHLGWHENTCYGWVSGRTVPDMTTAQKMADLLDTTVAELWPTRAATPLAGQLADRKMTADELAALAGVRRRTVDRWLAGHASPDPAAAARLVALGLSAGMPSPRRRDRPTPCPTAGPGPLTVAEVFARPATGRPGWIRWAGCHTSDLDPETWWAEDGSTTQLRARRVCAACPVLGDCRDA